MTTISPVMIDVPWNRFIAIGVSTTGMLLLIIALAFFIATDVDHNPEYFIMQTCFALLAFIQIVFAFPLWRGRNWARIIMIVAFSIIGICSLLTSLLRSSSADTISDRLGIAAVGTGFSFVFLFGILFLLNRPVAASFSNTHTATSDSTNDRADEA